MAMKKARGGNRMPKSTTKSGSSRKTAKKGVPGGRYANTMRPSGGGYTTR